MRASGLGDADGACGGSDHGTAVAHHQELSLFCLPGNQGRQALHIDSVEKAVHLVEGIEGRWTEALQREQVADVSCGDWIGLLLRYFHFLQSIADASVYHAPPQQFGLRKFDEDRRRFLNNNIFYQN